MIKKSQWWGGENIFLFYFQTQWNEEAADLSCGKNRVCCQDATFISDFH